jgi:hypothetical protein
MPAASQAYPRSVAASAYAFCANFASPSVIKAVCDLLSVAPKINACSCSHWATSSASASFPWCSKALLRSVVKVFRDKLTSASGLASVLFVENFCPSVSLLFLEGTSQSDHGVGYVICARVALPLLVDHASNQLLCLAKRFVAIREKHV